MVRQTLTIVKKGDGADKGDSEPQSVIVPPKKANTYTVTLSGGKGYTLTALGGSVSPVDEGKSYAFQFALAKGYQKTKSFVVKVNGVNVTLTAQNTYTIQDIRENKTVTVEGVKKKSSGGSSGGSSGSSGGSSGSGSGGSSGSGSGSTQTPPSQTPETPPTQGIPQETPGADSSNPAADNTNPAANSPEADTKQTTAPKKDTEKPKTQNPKQDSKSDADKEQTNVQNNTDEMTGTDGDTQVNAEGTDRNTLASLETAALAVENGAVTVTVNNVDETACTAKVADTAAVAGAVLTQEELTLAEESDGIEIRIDVARMETVPPADAQVIEQGVEAYQNVLSDLNMGMYVDISMFMRKGSGDWNAVHTTNEPVEIVLNIPQELATLSADFYILRAHEGAYLLLEDLDDNPETITIRTEAFSTYAITYQLKNDAASQPQDAEIRNKEAQSAAKTGLCGLCRICPTIFGICCFIWLAVFAVIAAAAIMIIIKKKNRQ